MNIQARTATLGAVLAATSLAFAQSNPAYIRFTPSATKGALYRPDSGPLPQVAILIVHRTANNKLVQCGSDLAGLPRADGIVFVDAHPGVSVNGLRSLNPAVMNEANPRQIDPALDPFSPRNGFNPSGPSHYSDDFKQRYFKAQAARMNRLIDAALQKAQALKGDDWCHAVKERG